MLLGVLTLESKQVTQFSQLDVLSLEYFIHLRLCLWEFILILSSITTVNTLASVSNLEFSKLDHCYILLISTSCMTEPSVGNTTLGRLMCSVYYTWSGVVGQLGHVKGWG